MANQVPGDQEVGAEAHVLDDFELEDQPVGNGIVQLGAPPFFRPLHGHVQQVVIRVVVELRGDWEVRQLRVAEFNFNITPLGNPKAVVTSLRKLSPLVAHLLSGLEVVLIAMELEPVRITHERTGLDAQQCVMRGVVVLFGVVRVVGDEDGGLDLLGDLQQFRVGLVLSRDAVILNLDKQIVSAEDVLHPGRLLQGVLLVAVHKRLENMASEATGCGDHAFAVIGKNLPIDPGFVVVPLHERPAGELDEVLIARVVLGQRNQVVIELLAALGAAAGIIDAASSARPLVAAVISLVELAANYWLDVMILACPIEVEHAIHIPMIGDAKAWHPICCCLSHEFIKAGCAVQHGVLGVHVQMCKRRTHALMSLPGWSGPKCPRGTASTDN